MKIEKLARFLGWFSIGIGAAELLAPRALARLLGVRSIRLLRLYGVRELRTGVGILFARRLAPYLWARVVGDVIDLASLGVAITRSDKKPMIGLAGVSVAGITALDVIAARQLS